MAAIDRTKCVTCNEPKTSSLHDITLYPLLTGAHEFVEVKPSFSPKTRKKLYRLVIIVVLATMLAAWFIFN